MSMQKKDPYAVVHSNETWTETAETESSISIKTMTGFSGGEILDRVREGKDLPEQFLHNHNIVSVTVLTKVTQTLERKEGKE